MHTKEGQERQQRKEAVVRLFLTSVGIPFEVERHATVIDAPERNLRIFLAVDGSQHGGDASLSDANHMDSFTRATGDTRRLLWVRFNPDTFKRDGAWMHVWRPAQHAQLRRVIETFEPEQPVSVKYLFFDTAGGVPCLISRPDYPASLKSCVI
jgi:hypothetical protein